MSWWSDIGSGIAGAAVSSFFANDAAEKQADATKSASNLTAQSAANSIAEIKRQYNLSRADSAPYRKIGVDSLGKLAVENDKPLTSAEVMSDPGYQFGLQQGQQALDRKAAASGGRVSGAALKAANEYGTNYATTGYNAAYQRRNDRLNRLASLAGIGQTATGASSSAGASAANAMAGINTDSSNALSNLVTSQSNASANAALQQGGIWGNALNKSIANYK